MNERVSSFGALNSNLLEKLTADLLFVRGHTQIRRTGGPGDGGRDIHSLDPEGKAHLTQCKYHQDSDLACSSSDLSELPMAMIKFGYLRGLFVTNARISPQGKREYLNDYPELTLDFLDGEALSKEVLSNGLLTALWYEGAQFSDVNVLTAFPTIIRRHEGDLPFTPFDSLGDVELTRLFDYLATRHDQYKFALRGATASSQPFEPYRAPEPLTLEEGATPFIRVMEVAALGRIALPDLPILAEDICKGIIEWLLSSVGGLSVRVGRPHIVPLEGTNRGSQVLSSVGPISFTATQAFCGEEKSWFAARPNLHWSSRSDARVTEADWIRLYAKDLDCCLSYEINTRISSAARTMKEAIREIQTGGWERSVFCLLPKWETWPYVEIPEPDETVLWTWNDHVVCGWLHWSILGNPVPIRTARSPSELPGDKESEERRNKIEALLRAVTDATILDPTDARYMVALAGTEPFPDIAFTRIDTADVVVNPEILPSPIRPSARSFRLSSAWLSGIDLPNATDAVEKAISEFDSRFFGAVMLEQWREYLLINIQITPHRIDELPTEALLNDFFDNLKRFLPILQRGLLGYGTVESATKEFWAKRYNVNFGISYE
jgi:hypothetical protein